MVNRIIALIKEKGMSVDSVEKQLGFGNGAIKRFGINSPSIDKIILLSDFLNVSIDYLIYGNEKKLPLKDNEQELVDFYNMLPEYGQAKLIGIATGMAEVYKEQVETKVIEVETPMIEIRHSIYKVSAGTGYSLDDGDHWDTIEIPDTPEANKADFALTISGDSMEPVYYDGDIVLIKSQPAVDSGEIGIFIIENDGYIKKYGGDRLISLNAKYDDIMFSDYNPDDIRCMGLVIGRV